MARAAALVDGGVWANNPIGVAAIEAIGMLGWSKLPRLRGKLPMAEWASYCNAPAAGDRDKVVPMRESR
ncbi:MAG: hypothetical protein ABWY82_06495 [Tardiphaga sp.]|jgi:hypothetical protein